MSNLCGQLKDLNISDKDFIPVLKKIVKNEITMDESHLKRNKLILENLKTELIHAMKKEDVLFNDLFTEFYYSGSSYIGLRISEPNEFDLNLILKFPFKAGEFKVLSKKPIHPSFAGIQLVKPYDQLINSTHPKCQIYQPLKKWFNNDGYLLHKPIINWIKGVVDKVLQNGPKLLPKVEINRSDSGPAVTLNLKFGYGSTDQIDIDLVPVFRFRKEEQWPENFQDISAKCSKIQQHHKFWFIVPKTVKNDDIPQNKKNYMWRMDFPEMEKYLIKDQGCVKLVIKLLKLFRDKQKLNCLASYHLKTIIMLEVLKHPQPEYWSESNLGSLFVHALEVLAERLKEGKIPFVFNQNANLLEGRVNPTTAQNYSGRIKNILKDLRKDVSNLEKYL